MRSAKTLTLLILLLFVFQRAQSQVWAWAKKPAAPDNSGHHGIASVIDVLGNHVVLSGVDTGWVWDGNYISNAQFYVTKYDNQGNLLWSKNFTVTSGHLWSYDITTDSAGSVYLLTEKYNRIDGQVYNGPNAPNYLTKLSATGNFRWAKPMGAVNIYYRKQIKSDGRNLYLYSGVAQINNFQFLDTTFTAPTPPGGIGPEFTFLAKLDSSGSRLWQKLFIDTLGYNLPLAMDINTKKQIVFSGFCTKKIWVNGVSIINNSTIWYQNYYAILNTDNGQSINVTPWTITYERMYPSISINDSADVIFPHQIRDTLVRSWTGQTGTFNLIYPPGVYLVALNNSLFKIIKQPSAFKLDNVYDVESDASGNVYASLKLFFTTGQFTDSAFLALAKYKIDRDSARAAVWQANVGGSYYSGGIFTNAVSVGPSVDVRNNEVSFTGGFRNTGNFGPHTVVANSTRKGFVTAIRDGACIISGKAFIDGNNNGTFDAGERPVQGRLISTQNNYITFTDVNGNYGLYVDTGSYTLQLQNPLPYYNPVPASHAVSFTAYGQTATNRNFALQAALTVNDLEIDVTPVTIARPGRPLLYQVTLMNKGTTTLSNNYSLKMGSFLSFGNSDSSATVTGDSVIWSYTNLKPYEARVNRVTCNVSTGATVNTVIKSIGYAFPITGDTTPVNNVDTAFSLVRASYDPNDKITFPVTSVHIDSAQQGKQFLEYIIRFQNTGNDTAFQVRLVDSLTSKLNIQTFELISSSHPVQLSRRGQRTMEFYFPNILLPDSTTNEARSHGFAKFRVKPVSSVILTDSVYNFADIYFDYNSAVRTNTIATGFRTTIVTGINDPQLNTSDLRVYPNPATSFVVYKLEKSPRETLTARIYDISGRILYSREISGNGAVLTGQIAVPGLSAGAYFLEVTGRKTRYIREFLVRRQ